MHHSGSDPRRRAKRVRRGVRLVTALAALLTLGGMFASMASSAPILLHDVQTLHRDSPFDSVNQKGIFTGCPTGKSLISPGGRLFGETLNPPASFQQLVSQDTVRGAVALARELTFGTPSSWRVTADAICAAVPPGRQEVQATSAFDSNPKQVTATCPFGKSLLGPTARVNGGSGHVIIDDLTPSVDRKAVTLTAFEDPTGTTESWSLKVGAICMDGDPVEIERIVAGSAQDSKPIKTATAKCSPGKRVVGVGGDVSGASGGVTLTAVSPNDIPGQEVNVAAREIGGNLSTIWSIRAYALCARSA